MPPTGHSVAADVTTKYGLVKNTYVKLVYGKSHLKDGLCIPLARIVRFLLPSMRLASLQPIRRMPIPNKGNPESDPGLFGSAG
jgi:hypothetical protein